MSADGKVGVMDEQTAAALEAMSTFPTQEDARKKRRAAPGADDDGYASADDGESDLKSYIDATKESLMASINAVQSQVQSYVAASVGSLANTVATSCGNLATQVERRIA